MHVPEILDMLLDWGVQVMIVLYGGASFEQRIDPGWEIIE